MALLVDCDKRLSYQEGVHIFSQSAHFSQRLFLKKNIQETTILLVIVSPQVGVFQLVRDMSHLGLNLEMTRGREHRAIERETLQLRKLITLTYTRGIGRLHSASLPCQLS